MKKLGVLLIGLLLLTACGKEKSLIKEHVEKELADMPSASYDYEELRKDSVHTVSDSIQFRIQLYKQYTGFIEYLEEKGHSFDNNDVLKYLNTSDSLLISLRSDYTSTTNKLEDEIKELEQTIKDARSSGMGAFMAALGQYSGVDFDGELAQKKKELEQKIGVINLLNDIHQNIAQINYLSELDGEIELCEFWYVKYIVDFDLGGQNFEKRHAYLYKLASVNNEIGVVDRNKLKL